MQDITTIGAAPTTVSGYFKAMAKHKSLIWVFALHELKGLYAQTYFGVLWAVIRPLITLAIFTVIFKFFLRVQTQSPYYLFAFTGILSWNLFSNIVVSASSAVLQKQDMIRKMYFPRLILPVSKILIACVEGGISLLLLLIMILIEHVNITVGLLSLPLFVLLNIICGFAVAVWMNGLNIRFRDLNQIMPTIIGIGIWVTPVFYPTAVIPDKYGFFLYINPMATVIKGYRFALLGEPFPELNCWYAILAIIAVGIGGIWYFIRTDDRMVDYA